MKNNSFKNIPENFLKKWQDIADLIASILKIPAALIMKTDNEYMEVFIASKTENNPYHVGDKEHWQGLYCETVIKTQKTLRLPNALNDKDWDKNPDIKLGMIAYLGVPLNFPDKQPFGTLCVLNNKEHNFTPENEKLLYQFKNVIELDLTLIQSLDLNNEFDKSDLIQKLISQNDEYIAINEELRQTNNQLYEEKEKVSESEKHFRLLVENAPDAIFIQTNWKFAYVNNAGLKLLGAENTAQLIGKPVIDRIHKDDHEKVKQRITGLNVLRQQQSIVELQFIKLDGTPIYAETSGIPFKFHGENGALVFIRDISERKELHQQLIETNQNLENIFANSPMGIFVIDVDENIGYKINSVNPVHETILGHTNEDVKGKPLTYLSQLFGDEVYDYVKNLYDHVVETRNILSFEDELLMNGKLVQFKTKIKPLINKEGKVYRLIGTNSDISQLKKIEKNLIAAKEKAERNEIELNKAQAITHIGSWYLDLETNEVQWSEELFKMYNFDPQKPVPPYTEHMKLFTPESWEMLSTSIAQTKETGIPYELELQTIRKDGTNGWMWVRGEVVKDNMGKTIGLWGAAQDISERKKAEEEIINAKKIAESSEEKFRKAVLTNPDAITINRLKDGVYMMVNEGFCKTFEYSAEEVTGASSLDLHIWHDIEQRILYANLLKTNGFIENFETKFKTKSGKVLNCLVSSSVIMLNNETHTINITKDISYLKNIEHELIQAKNQAEESDRLKTAFLQNMSHEVRTPLNAIVGFSKLISHSIQSNERLAKFSELISKSSEKLIGIITDVIEVSQIQSSSAKPQLIDFDFISFLHSITNEFKIIAIEKDIEFKTKLNIPYQEYIIKTDKEKLKRILFHLIDNAIKFTQKGEVIIVCEISPDNIKFTISDTGIGISEEMQKLIFEPFRQVEIGLARNYGGNGLGLSIVKAYTELLGGSISLKSEVNSGTSFYITIPLYTTVKVPAEVPKNTKKYTVNTILIVEDEYSNYRYLVELLEGNELNILHAVNGKHAVDICTENETIDLIFMDIKMPIMDGHTAAKLIKGFRPEVPIIAQTAYALDSELEIFSESFDDYLTKPINEELLSNTLKKYF